ncbi:alkaline phosphatase family protein [Prolixibacteraceae bacterium JC049]|nr:alkaline phosphatase family protein [Prolixibacteraceae bacterium JC049]
MDTKLLDSYGRLPDNIRQFYLTARAQFAKENAEFTNDAIIAAAQKYNLQLMGGPMLGNLQATSVSLWLRAATNNDLRIVVKNRSNKKEKSYWLMGIEAGKVQRITLDGLTPNTAYTYRIELEKKKVGEGGFTTAPAIDTEASIRITFGSCFHKIGLHNPNLIQTILKRKPQAMLLLGDIAVDDRENKINMHRADYLLRDVSGAWEQLAANVPLYTSWDDHDYFNNDLSGIPSRFTKADVQALREIWQNNWNNPEYKGKGIYFNTRIGSVEVFMLDTRSCRRVEERGEYGSYLGKEQMEWLKAALKESTATFKIISSGTMWSDDISNGKDSWGTWDTAAREEIFRLIETEKVNGVLLISGDRHGARGFQIPRSSEFKLYEFEAASLGGVKGPPAMAQDATNQLFGHYGKDLKAFGEFTFETKGESSTVIFRLINEKGEIMEEHSFTYSQLLP